MSEPIPMNAFQCEACGGRGQVFCGDTCPDCHGIGAVFEVRAKPPPCDHRWLEPLNGSPFCAFCSERK